MRVCVPCVYISARVPVAFGGMSVCTSLCVCVCVHLDVPLQGAVSKHPKQCL